MSPKHMGLNLWVHHGDRENPHLLQHHPTACKLSYVKVIQLEVRLHAQDFCNGCRGIIPDSFMSAEAKLMAQISALCFLESTVEVQAVNAEFSGRRFCFKKLMTDG